jgi:hypothetical protein
MASSDNMAGLGKAWEPGFSEKLKTQVDYF